MITRKTRRGIIVLVLLTSFSFWAAREQQDDKTDPVTGLDTKLNYVLHDFELQVYDINGKTSFNIKAPVLRNNPLLEMGTIENPLMILHQQDITWNLTADSATITADKEHVELSGKVYMNRLELLTGNRIELNTSELKVEVSPQTADPLATLSFYNLLNNIDAVGMRLDMMNDNFILKQQVKAIYAVN